MENNRFQRKNTVLLLAFNSLIFLSAAIIASHGIIFGAGDGQVKKTLIGFGYFLLYTMDSNILAGISSLVLMRFCLKRLRNRQTAIPGWAVLFQLMSTACLCLTMFVATVFLGPGRAMGGESYFVVFQGNMFFFHLVNPVLAIVSFTCLLREYRCRRWACLVAAIPTVIYSIVYFVMVVVLKKWADFYNFTLGGRYFMVPIVIAVIYALILAAAALLVRFHNRHVSTQEAS